MRPQQQPAGRLSLGGRRVQVERVVHVHRGMVGREVEREEVVPLRLDLRAQRDRESDLAENVYDLIHHAGDGMLGADPARSGRHGEIDPCLLLLLPLGLQGLAPRGERRLEAHLELVDRRAVALALVERKRGHPLERGGELARLAAEHGDLLRLERPAPRAWRSRRAAGAARRGLDIR